MWHSANAYGVKVSTPYSNHLAELRAKERCVSCESIGFGAGRVDFGGSYDYYL